MHAYTQLQESNRELQTEIENGQANMVKLNKIRETHTKQRLRLASELELLEVECERLKEELKALPKDNV
jgi:peptidoglycan hydrolase CwlO-like protein